MTKGGEEWVLGGCASGDDPNSAGDSYWDGVGVTKNNGDVQSGGEKDEWKRHRGQGNKGNWKHIRLPGRHLSRGINRKSP